MRKNELHDGVTDLVSKYFTSSHIHKDPIIFAGCAGKRLKAKSVSYKATTVPVATPQLEST